MQVLSPKKLAFVHECINCGALLTYQIEDIYENCYIYCPVCRTKQKSALDLSYDGVVKDNGSNTTEKK